MQSSWQVLERAIPRGVADRVAQALHVTADYVRRWRREPVGDESPTATGQRSPLDRACDLVDAVFLANPQGACLIVEHISAHYQQLINTHALDGLCSARDRALASAQLLKESAEAINALNVEGLTQETLQQLIEMRDAADSVIARAQFEIRRTVGKGGHS